MVDHSYTTSGRESRNVHTFVAQSEDNNAKYKCEARNEMSVETMTAQIVLSVHCKFSDSILTQYSSSKQCKGLSIKDVEILKGVGGLKFRCCKILEGRSYVNQGQNFNMGEGGIKNSQTNSNVFYGGPLSRFLW